LGAAGGVWACAAGGVGCAAGAGASVKLAKRATLSPQAELWRAAGAGASLKGRILTSITICFFFREKKNIIQSGAFVMITSHLITRFFSLTPEMEARDQAVEKRHRNQESLN
jgi:hypothetical protein